jgi:pre-mRNA-splicing helicase BRR2
VEDVDGEQILHHEYVQIKANTASEELLLSFTVPLFDPLPPQYFVRAAADHWLVPDAVLPLSFRQLLLPEKFPPHTELLDMQPIDATRAATFGGRVSHAQHFERRGITQFNAIQTQTFKALYSSDDNVLVSAPLGCGKSVLAELALLRMFAESGAAEPAAGTSKKRAAAAASATPSQRAVYVVAQSELAAHRAAEWRDRLAPLGKKVALFGDDGAANLAMLKECDVCVTTAQRWDVVSRRWRQRKLVQQVRLYIFDQMQLLGGDDGPTLEVIVSRARYVAAQTERPTRIVALSASLANARTVAEWIGAPSSVRGVRVVHVCDRVHAVCVQLPSQRAAGAARVGNSRLRRVIARRHAARDGQGVHCACVVLVTLTSLCVGVAGSGSRARSGPGSGARVRARSSHGALACARSHHVRRRVGGGSARRECCRD